MQVLCKYDDLTQPTCIQNNNAYQSSAHFANICETARVITRNKFCSFITSCVLGINEIKGQWGSCNIRTHLNSGQHTRRFSSNSLIMYILFANNKRVQNLKWLERNAVGLRTWRLWIPLHSWNPDNGYDRFTSVWHFRTSFLLSWGSTQLLKQK